MYFADSSLQGYIHLLSPVQSSSKKKTKYFNFKLQTAETDSVRLVCYSPEKRINLQQAFQNKSPVKIQGIKRSKTKEDEYSISKAAKIAPSDVQFPYNKTVASHVSTVEDCLSASLYDKVDIKVKVVTKSENKQPVLHREKTKYRVECLVADHTESIKLIYGKTQLKKYTVARVTTFKT